MIIEIKDLPNGQTIDKIDIHIDFQKGIKTVSTSPNFDKSENDEHQESEHQEVPQEMIDTEF